MTRPTDRIDARQLFLDVADAGSVSTAASQRVESRHSPTTPNRVPGGIGNVTRILGYYSSKRML